MRRPARVLAAALLACALLAGCTDEPVATRSTPAADVPASGSAAVAEASSPGPAAVELLTDTHLAADAGPEALRRAVQDELAVAGGWVERMASDLPQWPVYVGDARIGLGGSVELDLVLSAPAEQDGELVLRWLPSSPVLGQAVDRLAVEVGGAPIEARVDREGARILVPVPTGRPTTVRVRATYRVPDRKDLQDDGSPAGIGLLARTDGTVALGHWLPLVTLEADDGPMVPRGDVGAFPAGAFSIRVDHDGALVTGANERRCPGRTSCTWLRGAGLRDVSAVLFDDAASEAVHGEGVSATVHAPPGTDAADTLDRVADESLRGLEALGSALGPLPWEGVDVVAVPIGPGALGMEFPGLVWIDPRAWPEQGPELGSYVLAHEMAHQWFHALVGNGSLTAPVVDESLAQYLSVVLFDELFGSGAGEDLAAQALGGRYERALADGVPDDVPAQPLADFATDRSYGAAVYGRAGQAWLEAEDEVGRPALLQAVRELVDRHGLREVDAQGVLDVVGDAAPGALRMLAAGWGMSPP